MGRQATKNHDVAKKSLILSYPGGGGGGNEGGG